MWIFSRLVPSALALSQAHDKQSNRPACWASSKVLAGIWWVIVLSPLFSGVHHEHRDSQGLPLAYPLAMLGCNC